MPLTVVFGRPSGAPDRSAIYNHLKFHGPALFADQHPMPIARHERHHWTPTGDEAKDVFYTRLDIAGPLCLKFQRGEAETNYGPYSAFSMVDGVGYVEGDVFAFEDSQHQDWYFRPRTSPSARAPRRRRPRADGRR
jgi:hypothetical protein